MRWHKFFTFLTGAALAANSIATSAHAQVLKAVEDRGALNCGVCEGLYGFSARGRTHHWGGGGACVVFLPATAPAIGAGSTSICVARLQPRSLTMSARLNTYRLMPTVVFKCFNRAPSTSSRPIPHGRC